MTAPATSRAGGPGGSSSRASSPTAGPRDGACRPAGAALAALATVRDPELDEPITALGFVTSCTVSADGDARVRLRLPTYFCAPNFAFLMVADAYDAVSGVPGVRSTEVVLEDHFASDAINGGVAAQAGFAASFDGEAVSELHGLRADFLRKAVLAGTDQLCRPLLAAGTSRARCAAAGGPGHRRTSPRGGGPAAPAAGQVHAHQHRGEQQHLPRHAAAQIRLRGPGTGP